MIANNCIYYVGDEDCNKCVKHGLIASCGNCTDFDDGSVKEKPKHNARWIPLKNKNGEILAWMPLSEPYKRGDRNEL